MGSLDSEYMCLTAKNFGWQEEKHQHLPNRRERPLIKKTGWGTTERERQMDRKRGKEGGGMQCFMKKEDKSLIDVDNTGKMYCHLS